MNAAKAWEEVARYRRMENFCCAVLACATAGGMVSYALRHFRVFQLFCVVYACNVGVMSILGVCRAQAYNKAMFYQRRE